MGTNLRGFSGTFGASPNERLTDNSLLGVYRLRRVSSSDQGHNKKAVKYTI
jgi:hypothetical protein